MLRTDEQTVRGWRRAPKPERDSIFGDTYDGVPTPNTIIEHGYPTRFHGPVLTMPQLGFRYRERPYARPGFMGMGSYPGYHRRHGFGSSVSDQVLSACLATCESQFPVNPLDSSAQQYENAVKQAQCQEGCASYAAGAPIGLPSGSPCSGDVCAEPNICCDLPGQSPVCLDWLQCDKQKATILCQQQGGQLVNSTCVFAAEPAPAPLPAPSPVVSTTPLSQSSSWWSQRSTAEKVAMVGGGVFLAAVGVAVAARKG